MLLVLSCCGHWWEKTNIRDRLRKWFVESLRLPMRWAMLVLWRNTLKNASIEGLYLIRMDSKLSNIIFLCYTRSVDFKCFLPGRSPIWRPSPWKMVLRASSTILNRLHILSLLFGSSYSIKIYYLSGWLSTEIMTTLNCKSWCIRKASLIWISSCLRMTLTFREMNL